MTLSLLSRLQSLTEPSRENRIGGTHPMTTARDVIRDTIDEIVDALHSAPDSVRLELAALLNPWRPIETAPKDRQFHLLYCAEDGSIWLAAWQTDQWYGVDNQGLTRSSNAFVPTHWLPLPATPAQREASEDRP